MCFFAESNFDLANPIINAETTMSSCSLSLLFESVLVYPLWSGSGLVTRSVVGGYNNRDLSGGTSCFLVQPTCLPGMYRSGQQSELFSFLPGLSMSGNYVLEPHCLYIYACMIELAIPAPLAWERQARLEQHNMAQRIRSDT